MATSRNGSSAWAGLVVFRPFRAALRRFQAESCVWIAAPRLGAVNLLLELLLAVLLTIVAFVPLDPRESE